MTYEVLVDPKARDDLYDIHAFIAQDSPTAAGKWIGVLEQAINSLSVMPHRVQTRDDLREGYRVLTVGAYLIFFRVVGNTVEITRVIHSSRDIGRAFNKIS